MSDCGAALEQPAGVDAPATVLARPSSFDRLPALPPELGKLSADRACAATHPSRCRFHRRPLTTGTALMDGASLPPGLSDVPNRSPRKGSVCHSQPSPYAGAVRAADWAVGYSTRMIPTRATHPLTKRTAHFRHWTAEVRGSLGVQHSALEQPAQVRRVQVGVFAGVLGPARDP